MKAIVLGGYGSTDQLKLTEVSKPMINGEQLLIRIIYSSLNAADLDFVHGHPLVRFSGLFKPGYPILGSDCVGSIEALGNKVIGFNVGDIIWADLSIPLKYGAFADYVVVKASSVQKIPKGLDLVYAACLPTAAMVAFQNVRLNNDLKKGDKVLVNGAGGGIGTILVQLLKAKEVEVTAIDKVEKHQMLKSIGANITIDYEKEDFTEQEIIYDHIYDLVCTRRLYKCRQVLKKNGQYTMLGGSTRNILIVFIFGKILSIVWGQKFTMGVWDTNNQRDLDELANIYLRGIIKPVIDKVVSLEETIAGLKELEAGKVLGKIVVRIAE